MRVARLVRLASLAAVIGCLSGTASGQTLTWEGDSTFGSSSQLDYVWSDPSNWGNAVPSASTTALFVNNLANSKIVSISSPTTDVANGVRFAIGSSGYTFQQEPLFTAAQLQLQGTNSFIENLGSNGQQFNVGVRFSGGGSKTITTSAGSTGGLQFAGAVVNDANTDLVISKAGTGAITFSGSLTSDDGLTITNSNTGNITIGNATVAGSTVSVGGTGNTSFIGTLDSSSGLLTLTKSGSGTLSTATVSSSSGVSISNTGSGLTTIGSIANSGGNVSITNSGTATVNVGSVTGGGSFQVTNSDATGVVRLTSNVGATSVAFSGGGRVEVASGVTVSGTTTVSGTGSTLSGLGSFGNAVTIQTGGTLSPGVGGAGAISFTNGLALNDGSSFSWDLTNETTGFDSVSVNGALTIGSTAASVLNITGVSSGFWNTDRSWNVFTGNFTGTFANQNIFSSIAINGAAAPTTE